MFRWLPALVVLAFGPLQTHQPDARRPVVVASKPFGESYILAEMFAQLLEAHGIRADRRLGLGATQIAYGALRSGAIDVYPEYTGTGLIAILGLAPDPDPRSVFARVAGASAARDSVRWLPPLGFENTYAIAVRRRTADSLHLETLTDLARSGSGLRGGFTADFIGRPDGLPGLVRVYGVHLREVRALLPAVKYAALAAGSIDVIDGFSTDGLIARYDLVVLRDDRHFYPPYEAAAVVSAALQRDNPAAVAVLTELSDRIGVAQMRAMNRRLEVDGVPVAIIAADGLRALGLTPGAASATVPATADRGGPHAGDTGGRQGLGAYLRSQRGPLAAMTARHLLLVGISLAAAILIAVPLGLGLLAIPRSADIVIRLIGAIQTVPGIALLAFMIPLLGIGVVPALVALFLYSLYPILRNTYEGVRGTAPGTVDAGEALGMTNAQVMAYIRLPLAMPVIMAGVRTAAVIDVGTATLAAFIGAGGLGDPIVTGLALSDTRMILSGAIPAALLALAVDALLGAGQRVAARRWNAV
ncbi:MAG: glycine betaine ABC transporter substrate-binding protein [Gemmatimonadales bacterium]|jgi:osmoprotectant transport system permease protein